MSTRAFTIREGGHGHEVDAEVRDGRVLVAPDDLQACLGWALKPEGLCRAGTCVPRFALGGDVESRVDLETLAGAIGVTIEIDLDAAVVTFGEPG